MIAILVFNCETAAVVAFYDFGDFHDVALMIARLALALAGLSLVIDVELIAFTHSSNASKSSGAAAMRVAFARFSL